jgi:hypothetical protein
VKLRPIAVSRVMLAAAVLALVASLALPVAVWAQGPMMGPGMGRGMGMGLAGYGQVVFGAVAEALGITPAELSMQLEGGATLSQMALARDISPEALVSRALAAVSQLLDQQMPRSPLSQTQRQLLLAQIESWLRAQLDTPGFAGATTLDLTGTYTSPMLLQATRALSLSATELVTRLQAGASIADLAEEQGADLESDIIQPLLAPERARLQVMVNMDFLTQAQADAQLAAARGHLYCQAYMAGGMLTGCPMIGMVGRMMGMWMGDGGSCPAMQGCPFCW